MKPLVVCVLAALVPAQSLRLPVASASAAPCRHAAVRCGLFDMFQESEESKRRKDEQFKAQQEMLER